MATQTCDNPNISQVGAGLVVTCRYTGVSSGDLLEIPVGVDSGTIARRDYDLVSGTGTALDYTTYNSELSTANSAQVEDWDTTAAAFLTDATRVPFVAPEQHVWSVMTITGGGSDNVIVVTLYISTRFI